MNTKNPELNAKLEELFKILEDIGFKKPRIEIHQHTVPKPLTQKEAFQIAESLSDHVQHKSHRSEDGESQWYRIIFEKIEFYLFYELDEADWKEK